MKSGEFLRKRLVDIVTDDEKRRKIQYLGVYILLGCVSAFMTVLNVVTSKGSLTIATLIFAVLCLIDYLIAKAGGKAGMIFSSYLFMAEILALFVFFMGQSLFLWDKPYPR